MGDEGRVGREGKAKMREEWVRRQAREGGATL